MATNVTINGVVYPFPDTGDENYGDNVTAWAVAVSSSLLQKTGGSFPLTADVNFGSSFGLIAKYLKSVSSNIATTGVVRFANNEGQAWRNAANSADLVLKVNASNQLEYDGAVVTTVATLANSRAVVTDGTGTITTATTTATEIGYVNGVTSAIQAQLNAKEPTITVLPIAKGGTNSSTALNSGRAMISTAGAIVESTVTSTELGRLSGIGSSAVGISDTQTLTNKTLTTPIINGIRLAQSAKTANYTLTLTDDVVSGDSSGGTFAFTVPAAGAGNAGKHFTLVKTDSSFTAITTATGIVTSLNTQGESVTIYSDGSAWSILRRYIPSVWTSFSMTIIGSSSNPTKGGVTLDNATWRRVGDSMEIRYQYQQNSAGSAGTGSYLFTLPGSQAIDTTKLPVSPVNVTSLGPCYATNVADGLSATSSAGTMLAANSTQLAMRVLASATTQVLVSSDAFSLSNADVSYSFTALVPISGWNG